MTEDFKEEVRELESDEWIGCSQGKAVPGGSPAWAKAKFCLLENLAVTEQSAVSSPRLAAPRVLLCTLSPKQGQGLGLGRSLGKEF